MPLFPRRFSLLDWTLGAALGATLLARRKRLPLQGAAVLVTGGSRGLGLLLARELSEKGARLALCARDPVELEETRRELAAKGREVHVFAGDVGDEAQARAIVEQAVERLGGLDVLINNAGIIQVAPLEALSLRDFQKAHDANFWGTVHTTLAALPALSRGRGAVVNVTSIGGTVPVPHLLPYTAAKFAATGFSQGLGLEAGRLGIHVTTVVPGLMRTGSFVNALVKGQKEREMEWFSLGASLPGISMDADRAARRIVQALERGERFVVLGLPAKVLRLGHALLPGLTSAVLSGVEKLLPGPGGAGPTQEAEPGWQHRTGLARSFLTALGNRAAQRNREVRWARPSTVH